MENFGILGLIPPLLTIVLAFITKDVVVSLFAGIFSGALIVAFGNPFMAMLNITDIVADNLSDGWNIRIFLFCALLGGLVGMLSRTGATRSFGTWASKKIKNPKTTLLMSWFCGLIIFIDDYFNSLAVGTVMRPIADKNRVSRAKLSWVIDSTAAPVCILMPISSWVVTVMSVIKSSGGFESLGMTEFQFFIRSVPYNLYAILTLIMVLVMIYIGRDYGPMRKSEANAKEGVLWNEEYGEAPGEVKVEGEEVKKANVWDMLIPIILLIVSAVFFFPFTTYLMEARASGCTIIEAMHSMSIADAFNNTDASYALLYAALITVALTYVYYLCRRLFKIKEASESLVEGLKSMVPALIILALAWTIGTFIKSSPEDGGLGLASFLSKVVVGGGFPLALVPFIVFILSGLIAFSTGTSWGTFSIMLPITLPIAVGLGKAKGMDPSSLINMTLMCTAAVLGGGVFGDHASPISDTTILSSTGAGCPHLEHVKTQLPYAGTVAVCSAVGFLVGGLTSSLVGSWIGTVVMFVLSMIFLPKILGDRDLFSKKK